MKKLLILLLLCACGNLPENREIGIITQKVILAPSNLSGKALNPSQIRLTWQDNSDNETAFYIWRKKASDTSWGWANPAMVGANITTSIDSGLEAGITYKYFVKAYNPIDGGSIFSNYAYCRTMGNYTETALGLNIDMIYLSGGEFLMGSPIEDNYYVYDRERPQHLVNLTQFHIGKYEITQAQWLAVMGYNPSYFSPMNGFPECLECPIHSVSWDEVQLFISELNMASGITYRLPTEAEWEYACRSGQSPEYIFYNATEYSYGAWDRYCWFGRNSYVNGVAIPHPVGTKQPNSWGIYDMAGNIWEWCQDYFQEDYYSTSPYQDPICGVDSGLRVIRGGSYSKPPWLVKSAHRSGDLQYLGIKQGFRLVLSEIQP